MRQRVSGRRSYWRGLALVIAVSVFLTPVIFSVREGPVIVTVTYTNDAKSKSAPSEQPVTVFVNAKAVENFVSSSSQPRSGAGASGGFLQQADELRFSTRLSYFYSARGIAATTFLESWLSSRAIATKRTTYRILSTVNTRQTLVRILEYWSFAVPAGAGSFSAAWLLAQRVPRGMAGRPR